VHWQPLPLITTAMKDFANASFPPEVISVMDDALDAAVASLPEPVSSTQVQFPAEAILRAAHRGARPDRPGKACIAGVADQAAVAI